MVIAPDAERLGAGLDICVVAIPAHDVVFVLFIEDHFGVYVVFDYFFATAVVQVFLPGCVDFLAVEVVVAQRVGWHEELWARVHVVACENDVDECDDYGVDAGENDGAFADSDVPDLL